jgi:peroxiredoxin
MRQGRRLFFLALAAAGIAKLGNRGASGAQAQPERDLMTLPPDLPVPVDDGACDHLEGLIIPSMKLPSTSGRPVDLSEVDASLVVVYIYPRTGRPGEPSPPGWDAIPGARGCTPETCGFRDHHAELKKLGADVFGLSTQTTEYQMEMVARLHVPFEVLSDSELAFARALRLPTFEVEGMTLIKRVTLVIHRKRIEKVFYPVFPPDRHALEVIQWLRDRGEK